MRWPSECAGVNHARFGSCGCAAPESRSRSVGVASTPTSCPPSSCGRCRMVLGPQRVGLRRRRRCGAGPGCCGPRAAPAACRSGEHALRGVLPGRAAVARLPDAAARDREREVRRHRADRPGSNGCRHSRSRRRTTACARAGATGSRRAASSRRVARLKRPAGRHRPTAGHPPPRDQTWSTVQGIASSFHGPSWAWAGTPARRSPPSWRPGRRCVPELDAEVAEAQRRVPGAVVRVAQELASPVRPESRRPIRQPSSSLPDNEEALAGADPASACRCHAVNLL